MNLLVIYLPNKNVSIIDSRARIVVENVFEHLKATWKRLMKKIDLTTEHILIVISACCILLIFVKFMENNSMKPGYIK